MPQSCRSPDASSSGRQSMALGYESKTWTQRTPATTSAWPPTGWRPLPPQVSYLCGLVSGDSVGLLVCSWGASQPPCARFVCSFKLSIHTPAERKSIKPFSRAFPLVPAPNLTCSPFTGNKRKGTQMEGLNLDVEHDTWSWASRHNGQAVCHKVTLWGGCHSQPWRTPLPQEAQHLPPNRNLAQCDDDSSVLLCLSQVVTELNG